MRLLGFLAVFTVAACVVGGWIADAVNAAVASAIFGGF